MGFLSIALLSLLSGSLAQTIQNSFNYNDTTTGFNISVTYLGCFYDAGTNNRTLNITGAGANINGGVTVQSCAQACQNGNYSFSGVEYGGECYCSSVGLAYSASSNSCTMACTGNSGQACGGGNAIAVYNQTLVYQTFSVATIPGWTTLNCIASANGVVLDLKGGGFMTPNVTNIFESIYGNTGAYPTPQQCVNACLSTGFNYAYVKYRRCQCSSASVYAMQTVIPMSNCKDIYSPCIGTNFWCGDNFRNYFIVYQQAAGLTIAPVVSSQITYTTASTGTIYNSVGCFIDFPLNRILPVAVAVVLTTPQTCMELCSARGYPYAGVEQGNQCFCGSTFNINSWNQSASIGFDPAFVGSYQTGCTTQCVGNSTFQCGGSGFLQLYSSIASVSVVSNYTDYRGYNVSYQGCYSDNSSAPTSRTFQTQYTGISPSLMTPQLCDQGCLFTYNMAWSGVEYGNECWCSSTAPTSTLLPTTNCNMPCSGNKSLACGSGNVLSVYRNAATSIATVVSFGRTVYLGCFTDSGTTRILNNYMFTFTSTNTVELCSLSCFNLGYNYAGVSGGNKCYCATSQTASSASNACTTACTGNSVTRCGGISAMNVYFVNTTLPFIASGLTASNTPISTDITLGNTFATQSSSAANYVACAIDSVSARVMSTKATSVAFLQMTPQACIDACTAIGMPYSGVEWAQECWCNAVLPTYTAASQADCSMACTGNSSFACGNGNRLSIYANGGVNSISYVQTVNSYTLQGCFADTIASRTLRNRMTLNPASMTPALCTATCASSGYYYAGIEFANECWCDNNIQNGQTVLASNSTCGMPCNGQPNVYCGGGNAINIYYNPSLTRTTLQIYTTTQAGSSGIVWRYKACWGEPAGGRGLPNPLNNNAIGTVQSCLEMGSAAGYNACGLEYGGECWCNSITGNPFGGQVPQALCDVNGGMVCRGNSLNYCGAGNIFAFYSTGSQTYTSF